MFTLKFICVFVTCRIQCQNVEIALELHEICAQCVDPDRRYKAKSGNSSVRTESALAGVVQAPVLDKRELIFQGDWVDKSKQVTDVKATPPSLKRATPQNILEET